MLRPELLETCAVTMIVIEVGIYCQGDALDDATLVLSIKERGRGFPGNDRKLM